MTFIPEKKDALYVRGVVIACGMKDDQGDVAPNKEGVKRIFTNYLKQESDIQHSYISNFNVHQLENTITTNPIKINGKRVPVGSWIASHMVLNPSIVAMIRNGNLTGYSLGAIGDAGLNENITFENNFLNKSSLMYKDLKDYEELNPFFISFVEKASNGFTWEVMDYNQFLSKSSNTLNDENITGDMMTDFEEKDEMVKVSVVERLLGPLLNKASEDEEKEDEEKENEVETEISNKEIMVKLEQIEKQSTPDMVANAVVEAMKKMAKESMEKEKEEDEKEDEEKEENLDKGSKVKIDGNIKMDKSSNKLDEMNNKIKTEPREKFLGGKRRDEYGRVRKYV